MTRKAAFRVAALAAFCAVGCAAEKKEVVFEKRAPLFTDLGNYHHAVTTKSELAQRYFDQGLTLAYGFNHREAARSFRECTRLDPNCAMCFWGIALVLGPNINAPMDPADTREAYDAMQQALALRTGANESERAYIEALSKRYVADPPADRTPLDQAYSDAMRQVAHFYPDDPDAATLFAESVMDLHPWDYWRKDGTPQPWTEEFVAALESVLRRKPDHIGAIHYYIHATEASNTPERATPYADRLGNLVPGAGHLVHMPAHTYIRIGRYHDAALANIRAIGADDSYVTQCRAQGLYPLAYVPHNHHFLAAAATMEGWSAKAIEAALGTDAKTHHEMMGEPGMAALQHFSVVPLYVYVRFGRWDDVLAAPAPPSHLPYPTGVWHYARGRAFVAEKRLADAEQELAALVEIAKNPELENVRLFEINSAASILRVADRLLAGEIAAAKGDTRAAIQALRQGVELEDELRYQEPSDWMNPVRHSLGVVLLRDGMAREAEEVFRADLKINPENGWALFGLMQSLEAQGKKAQAAEVQRRFERAWANADVELAAARF